MATFEEMKAAVVATGATPEFIAHIDKTESLILGLGSADFPMTVEQYGEFKTSLTDAGNPDEAIAHLEKIKSLLLE